MHSRLTLLLSLLIVSTANCGRSARSDATPQGFEELAQAFRAKASQDRFAEGEKIQTLLPRCSITLERDTGRGTLVAYDYAHPSYKLTKSELLRLLGQPDGSDDNAVWYVLVHTNNTAAKIYVHFHDAYVVGSTITKI